MKAMCFSPYVTSADDRSAMLAAPYVLFVSTLCAGLDAGVSVTTLANAWSLNQNHSMRLLQRLCIPSLVLLICKPLLANRALRLLWQDRWADVPA